MSLGSNSYNTTDLYRLYKNFVPRPDLYRLYLNSSKVYTTKRNLQQSPSTKKSEKMVNQEVKVYGAQESPFSKRVEIALKLKGVEYEYVEEDLLMKSPELIRYNPIHGKVPVFLHNGRSMAESLVILEYIDETWESETSFLPKDPHERATSRFWTKLIDDKVCSYLAPVCRCFQKYFREKKSA